MGFDTGFTYLFRNPWQRYITHLDKEVITIQLNCLPELTLDRDSDSRGMPDYSAVVVSELSRLSGGANQQNTVELGNGGEVIALDCHDHDAD